MRLPLYTKNKNKLAIGLEILRNKERARQTDRQIDRREKLGKSHTQTELQKNRKTVGHFTDE